LNGNTEWPNQVARQLVQISLNQYNLKPNNPAQVKYAVSLAVAAARFVRDPLARKAMIGSLLAQVGEGFRAALVLHPETAALLPAKIRRGRSLLDVNPLQKQ
jgi:hypothetical protein